MKNIRKRIAALLACLALLAGIAAVAQEQNVADAIATGEEFTILEAALEQAGLLETLRGEGPFTVFAPTDAAFEALFEKKGVTQEDLLADPNLANLLNYHVVSGEVLSSALENGMTAETLAGFKVMVDMTAGNVRINTSNVTAADLAAGNGVVHTVDKVLLPPGFRFTPPPPKPSVADSLLANPDFRHFTTALEKAGLLETLRGEGPFTVFAPINAAFAVMYAKLGLTQDELLNHERLADILKYHIVEGELLSSGLENGMTAATLNGLKVMVDMTGEKTNINTSLVIRADQEAGNGVIHYVNKVLVPVNVRLQAAAPEVEYAELSRYDRSPEVKAMKDRFFELGGYYRTNKYDDLFKEHTVRMVKLFEEANGLPVDGIADAQMLRVLFSKDAKQP